MRVLHLTTEFPPIIYGGLGTATGGLVKALVKAGIETAVLLFGPPFAGAEAYGEFRAGSRQRHRRAAPRRRRPIFEVSWFLDFRRRTDRRSWRPDVLHLHSFWIWPDRAGSSQRLGIPLVYTVHSLDRAEYEMARGRRNASASGVAARPSIYGADRIISLTNSERELLTDYCPGVDERIRVVGNGSRTYRRPEGPGIQIAKAPIVLSPAASWIARESGS